MVFMWGPGLGEYGSEIAIVRKRIQKLEPENVALIYGFIVEEEYSEVELIRLAHSPDNVIKALIRKAKLSLDSMGIKYSMRSEMKESFPCGSCGKLGWGIIELMKSTGDDSSPVPFESLHIQSEEEERRNAVYFTTVAAESNFTDEHVANYLGCFGAVEEVLIACHPYKGRVFGRVTFSCPDAVRMVLAKGNPHVVRRARLLVKLYNLTDKPLARF